MAEKGKPNAAREAVVAAPNALDKAQAAQGRIADLMQQKKQLNAELKEAKADYQRHKKAVDEALGKGKRGPRKKKDNPDQMQLSAVAGIGPQPDDPSVAPNEGPAPLAQSGLVYEEEHPGEAASLAESL